MSAEGTLQSRTASATFSATKDEKPEAPAFGGPRNNDYGIWLFHAGTSGGLTPFNADGSPWVSFTNVRKKTTTGPAGPHLILFDPSIPLAHDEH